MISITGRESHFEEANKKGNTTKLQSVTFFLNLQDNTIEKGISKDMDTFRDNFLVNFNMYYL